MSVRRFVVLALLLVSSQLAIAPLGAEEGTPATLDPSLARLQSEDPKEAAWGAWLAAERGLTTAGPAVLQRLAIERELPYTQETWPRVAVLVDSAIRLQALPSRQTLLWLARGWTEATVVLVASRPGVEDATLLALFEQVETARIEPEPWLALGNLLHARKAPGFVHHVLAGYEMTRRIHAWSVEGPYPPWRRPGGGICYDGWRPIPEGLPPVPFYGLELDQEYGDRLLVGGPRKVWTWRRVERRREAIGFGGVTGLWPDRQVCRHEWLSVWMEEAARAAARPLPDVQQPTAVPPMADHHIRYVGRQPWARDLSRWMEGLHAEYWAMVRTLVADGRLTAAGAAALFPRIEYEVQDRREWSRRPLPPLPEVAQSNPYREPAREKPAVLAW